VVVALLIAGPAPAVRAQPGAEDAGEIIEDPELAGEPLAAPAAAPARAAAAATGPAVAPARVSAEARAGVDLAWDRATGEDVAVHWLRLDAEIGQALGVRARAFAAGRIEHVARAREGEIPDEVAGTLEARLLDAWVDARGLGLDVRAGNQIVPWGRVDLLSPGNVWNPLDLRDPFVEADALPLVPVPALRVDGRPVSWLGVSLVWQPFFVPMRVDLLGTDQALLGPRAPAFLRPLAEPLARLYADDAVVPLDDPALGAGPRQNLAASQLGGRVTASFGEAEVGATAFWGLSKLPTLTLSPELRAAVEAGPADTVAWLAVIGALAEGRTVLRTEYERTAQFVADVELPAGDVLVKGELGWAPRRALVRLDDAECRATCTVHRGVVQGAVQVERIEEAWQVLAEGLVIAATGGTADAGSAEGDLLFLGGGRTVLGGVGLVRWAPPAGDWDLGASVVVLSVGPSATALLSVGRAFGDHLRLEAGAITTQATDDSPLGPLAGGDLVYLSARVTN
jgi:hypothetical protein